ncbi:PHD-finger [Musa troglodytarum]|nr:PHD-finger [Musa troglodytarum]URE23087.1 PHD-finger [Musa troglodytarum]URE23089.1 PHD-finger [Musa troglodytarum]
MDLWDRICTALQVRKISLIDASTKGKMELRLVHGVAYGEPWFGRWGYRFGHGSYGVTEQMYQRSVDALHALPLRLLLPHLACFGREIPAIVSKYQSLCDQVLLTLGDLFRFMIELKTRLPPNSMDYHGAITEASCRWSTKRVEMAARVIVEQLKNSELRWVTRQEIRDAARAHIGDTGLLDYVLKTLGNHIFGNYIVRRTVNPITKVLEYCLEDISNVFTGHDNLASGNHSKLRIRLQLTRAQLMRDMFYLYKQILKEPSSAAATGMLDAIPVAVRMVMDTKQLVKDCQQGRPPEKAEGSHGYLKLSCSIRMNGADVERTPPHETVVVPAHATIGELKREVGRHFRAVYWGLKSFVADSIVGVRCGDSDLVHDLMQSGSSIVVEGRMKEDDGEEIYEGGNGGNKIVDCPCGGKEEDGERVICCDICEVWQHTRCVRIPDEDDVPPVFLCGRCENDMLALPTIQ